MRLGFSSSSLITYRHRKGKYAAVPNKEEEETKLNSMVKGKYVSSRIDNIIDCQLIFAGFYTVAHRRIQPGVTEVEFHGFQCSPDSCSEHLGLNNDLWCNTIGIRIGK